MPQDLHTPAQSSSVNKAPVRYRGLALRAASVVVAGSLLSVGGVPPLGSTISGIAPLPSAQAQDRVVLDHGHMDAFNVGTDGAGGLVMSFKEDVTGSHVLRDPSTVTIKVGDHAYTEQTQSIPGVERATYFLPQTQQANLPWPGWDTQGVREGGFESIDLIFEEVSGPGNAFMFQQEAFGGFHGMTTDGAMVLRSGSVIRQEQAAHVHVNWAFDAPGTYVMKVRAAGTSNSGVQASSATATYTWEVGSGGAGAGAAGAPSAPAAPGAPTAPGAPAAAPSAPGAPSASGAPGAPSAGPKQLPNTGSSVFSLPIAGLGLGVIVLGAGLVFATRRLWSA